MYQWLRDGAGHIVYVARVDDFPRLAILVWLELTLFWRKRALWASSRLC